MKTKVLLLLLTLLSTLHIMQAAPAAHPAEQIEVEAKLYPNPSDGVFFLELDQEMPAQYEVKVVNLIGHTVARKKVNTHERMRFDLNNVPKGVYFVHIDDGKSKLIRRIVVQ